MSEKKGNFIIYNSEGVVTLAGAATSLTNDAMSANFTDDTNVKVFMDASGVPRTRVRDYLRYTLQLRLTPGVGYAHADQSTIKTAIANAGKMATFVTSGFEDADFNWASNAYGFIESIGKGLTQGDAMSVDVTAAREALTDGTPIRFDGAWASL